MCVCVCVCVCVRNPADRAGLDKAFMGRNFRLKVSIEPGHILNCCSALLCSVCLSVCLSLCLSVCLSLSLSVCLSLLSRCRLWAAELSSHRQKERKTKIYFYLFLYTVHLILHQNPSGTINNHIIISLSWRLAPLPSLLIVSL